MAAPTKAKQYVILYYLILALLILYPLGQFTTIPLPIPNIHLYLQDIILVFLWTIIISLDVLHKIKIQTFPLSKPIIVFISIGLISLLYNIQNVTANELFVSSLYLVRWVGYAGIYFSLYFLTKNDQNEGKKFRKILIVAGFITAVFGMIQYFLYPDLRNLYYLGWDPHYLRIFGTFFDPGFLGLILVLTLNFLMLKILKTRNISYIIGSLVICITLALTYSRSSYLALFTSILYIAYIKRNWKFLIVTLILGVVAMFILPRPNHSEGVLLERTESSKSRIGSWEESVSLIKKSPIFGLGFNTLRYTRDANKAQYSNDEIISSHSGAGIENSFLFIWTTTGIVGLLSFLYLLYKVFTLGDNITKTSLISIIVHSLFNNSLFYPWVMVWLWVLAGTVSRKSAS